jgi:hypothetical protein
MSAIAAAARATTLPWYGVLPSAYSNTAHWQESFDFDKIPHFSWKSVLKDLEKSPECSCCHLRSASNHEPWPTSHQHPGSAASMRIWYSMALPSPSNGSTQPSGSTQFLRVDEMPGLLFSRGVVGCLLMGLMRWCSVSLASLRLSVNEKMGRRECTDKGVWQPYSSRNSSSATHGSGYS